MFALSYFFQKKYNGSILFNFYNMSLHFCNNEDKLMTIARDIVNSSQDKFNKMSYDFFN